MNRKTDRIMIFQRIVPHYRVPIFRKMIETFRDVVIVYGQKHSNDAIDNGNIPLGGQFQKIKNVYLGNENIFFSGILRKLIQLRPGVVITVSNLGNLNMYLFFLLRHFLHFKVVLWSFGYDPASGFDPKSRLSDRFRLFLYQKSDAVIFYWYKGKEEIEVYSKKKEHYFVAPNSLDTTTLMQFKSQFDAIGKSSIKEELGIKEPHHFLYVGRLLPDKEIEIAIRAFALIDKGEYNCRLTIVGRGSEEKRLRALVSDLCPDRVSFTGEIVESHEVGKWIYVSDAFVMPGRLGLSVIHSFCFGTPIISQRKNHYFHGEGVGYVKDGINGFLVEDGDVDKFSEKMKMIIADEALSASLRSHALETVLKEASIDRMIGGFRSAICHATDKALSSEVNWPTESNHERAQEHKVP